MLRNADAVGVSDLGDGQAGLAGGLEVVVIRPDPGGNRKLEVPGPGDALPGQVGGPERLGDDDIGVGQLALEDRVRAVLGNEVDRVRARRCLPARIGADLRDLIAGVGRRVPVNRIVIQHAQHLRHRCLLHLRADSKILLLTGSGVIQLGTGLLA